MRCDENGNLVEIRAELKQKLFYSVVLFSWAIQLGYSVVQCSFRLNSRTHTTEITVIADKLLNPIAVARRTVERERANSISSSVAPTHTRLEHAQLPVDWLSGFSPEL